jgi:hypothetical protein
VISGYRNTSLTVFTPLPPPSIVSGILVSDTEALKVFRLDSEIFTSNIRKYFLPLPKSRWKRWLHLQMCVYNITLPARLPVSSA